MGEITIRKASKEGARAFADPEWKKFNEASGYSFNKKRRYILAEDDGVIVGFVSFYTIGGVGHLSEVLVKEEYRGTGVGRKLIEAYEKTCRDAGCHKLSLRTCPEIHATAFEAYKKMGYRTEAVLKNDYMGKDWHLMSKGVTSD